MSISASIAEAVILCGGQGTRLRAVLPNLPKVLAPVAGRPFVTYQLRLLADLGVLRVVLSTGYMGEAVREVLGQRQHGMELVYSHEETPLDTGGALRLALPYLEGSEVLVLNGDSFLDADLSPMITPLSSPPPCLLAAANLMDTSRFGRLLLTDTHEVTAFLEKGLAGPGYINAGIYRFKRATLATIPPDRPVSLEREFFPDMIGKGLYARPLSGAFVDIGTPESFTMAEEFFHDFAG